jgi:hypothetical protein
MATQDRTQQTTCFSKMGAASDQFCQQMGSGEIKQVAAVESIFHKFIILQAFPEMKLVAQRFWGSELSFTTACAAIHFIPYGCLRSAGPELDRASPVYRRRAAALR